jgi:hypothetical protein
MHAKYRCLVRFVALVLIVWGLWALFRGYRGLWLSLRYGIFSGINLDQFWFHVLYLTLNGLIPVAAFISAYGLFRFMRWGLLSALAISSLNLVLCLYSSVQFVVMAYQWRSASPPPIPEGSYYIDVSMWPTWITGLGSGLLTFILLRGSVKTICSRSIDA